MNDQPTSRFELLGDACAWRPECTDPAGHLAFLHRISAAEAEEFERMRQQGYGCVAVVSADKSSHWWNLSDRQCSQIREALCRLGGICDLWIKVAILAGVTYMLLEVGLAFLPGGAVDRVLGGCR